MAVTTTQLQALESALTTGQLRVEYDGTKVEYRSVSELKQAIEYVKAALVEQGASPAPKRVSYTSFEKD